MIIILHLSFSIVLGKVQVFETRVGPKKLLIQYGKTSNILVIRSSLYESNTALMRQTKIKIYRALREDI